MKSLFEKRICVWVVALAAASCGAASRASEAASEPSMVLEFGFADDDKICGGYDLNRKKLTVDLCEKITADETSALSYSTVDSTVRSKATGQCMTRQQAIHTELGFDSCVPGLDVQKFTFADKTSVDGSRWSGLFPRSGPISGTTLADACLVTNWPQRLTAGEPSGVYLRHCPPTWKDAPHKAVVMRPPPVPMVLEFGIAGPDKICGGYDAQRNRLTVDRCDKILSDPDSVLLYNRNDQMISNRLNGMCLTRDQSTQNPSSFHPCVSGAEYQLFAFESKRDGWPALVPKAGEVKGTVTTLDDACMIAEGTAGTAGPSPLYFWACRTWEYTPNKAVMMRSVAR